MGIEKEIKEIDDEIHRLSIKRQDLKMRYISDNGLKDVLSNIRNSNISCNTTSFGFDKNDDVYVINLDLMKYYLIRSGKYEKLQTWRLKSHRNKEAAERP